MYTYHLARRIPPQADLTFNLERVFKMENELFNPDRIEYTHQLQSIFKLIILKPNSKKPVKLGWNQDHNIVPLTREEIAGNNVGIITGKLSSIIVVDVDNPRLFRAAQKYYDFNIRETFTVKSGRKGYHYYYRYPNDGSKYKTRALRTLGFDIMAERSFVVAPYSVHPVTGKLYEIIDNRMPAEPPEWVLNVINDRRPEWATVNIKNTRRISDEIKHLIFTRLRKGERSEAMMRVLVAMVANGFSDDQIRYVFYTYPIGDKLSEKGDRADEWLESQIEITKQYVSEQHVDNVPKQTPNDQHLEALIENIDVDFGQKFSLQPPPIIEPYIKYILPQKGLLVIIGRPGIGKSLFTVNLGLHLGNPPIKGIFGLLDVPQVVKTVFLQSENDRNSLWERIYKITQADAQMALGYQQMYIPGFKGRARCIGFHFRSPHFRSLVMRLKERTEADVLVIDPFISFSGAEENNNTEIRSALDALTSVAMEAELAVIMAHHPGKIGNQGIYTGRGASAIADWATNVLTLEYTTIKDAKCIKATVEKARNSAEIDPFYLIRNENLIFERFDPYSSFISAVVSTLQASGGTINTQKEFVEEIRNTDPNISKSAAIVAIKDAIQQGIVKATQGQKNSLKFELQ